MVRPLPASDQCLHLRNLLCSIQSSACSQHFWLHHPSISHFIFKMDPEVHKILDDAGKLDETAD